MSLFKAQNGNLMENEERVTGLNYYLAAVGIASLPSRPSRTRLV